MEFTHDEQTFIYDFDRLCVEQIEASTSVWMLYQQRVQNPPASVRDLKLGGSTRIMTTALAYLLRRRLLDGSLERFDAVKIDKTEDFIRELPAAEWVRLMECKDDFFVKAGIVDIASIMQFVPLAQKLSAGPEGWANPGMKSNGASPANSARSTNAGDLGRSHDGSPNPETPTSSGSSPEPML